MPDYEVVRTITSLLLGAGKSLKEASGDALNDPAQQHSRTVCFDDEGDFLKISSVERRSSRSVQDGRNGEESQRSREPFTSDADLSTR